jgi:hypothetical protein
MLAEHLDLPRLFLNKLDLVPVLNRPQLTRAPFRQKPARQDKRDQSDEQKRTDYKVN